MTDSKWTDTEREYILSVIDDHVVTIGCVDFMLRMKPFKMPYLKWSSLLMLIAIFYYGLSYYFFFVPLVPILVINIFHFIDMNIVVHSLNKAHNQLIREQILIDWDELMEFALEYFTLKKDTW
jgi:hypothetical protein